MAALSKMHRVVFLGAYAVVASCLFGPTVGWGQDVDQVLGGLLNTQLAAMGADYRVSMVETYTYGDEIGRTVFFDDRAKQSQYHFVPGDPRRGGFTDIAWLTDLSEGQTSSGLSAAQTFAAIARAMNTWDSVKSTRIPLYFDGAYNFDFGYVQNLLGFGGYPAFFSDVTHAGFLPKAFFDVVEPGGGNFILGVTFTFYWIDVLGNPTDINNDGKIDVAFREIYYNDNFWWSIDADFDVETVALHEFGHGLSQGHFGGAFQTPNGKLHFNPKAVMNAGYSGIQQRLKGTDIGGHSSIWGSWPRR